MNENFPYKKVLIVGCCGSGKSTLAVTLGEQTGLPVVHLDKLFWLPEWQERDREEFNGLMQKELEKSAWIIEGNFRRTFEHRLKYADFCVFLDYNTRTCLSGVKTRVEKYKGKQRPDMGEGCLEKEDPDFLNFIKKFKKTHRKGMLKTLKNSGINYKIFKTRRQTEKWINKNIITGN